jgi:uncharacterized protein with beta-barrel porin domain
MKQFIKSFRLTKIGGVAVSVAVGGMLSMASGISGATSYNIFGDGSSIVRSTDTDSIAYTIYSDNGANDPYIGNLSITLDPGVDLTGQVLVSGGQPWSVFTWEVGDGDEDDVVTFTGTNSTLILRGNNQIQGVVGWHIDRDTDANAVNPLDLIRIDGNDVTFNNLVNANVIDINQGGLVQFFGRVDSDAAIGGGSTVINYNGHNATVVLHDGVTVDGSITNSSINGTLSFTGSATVTGSVGDSSTSVGLVEVKGNASTVRIDGGLSTDRLDYQASATVSVGGNLDLDNNQTQNAVNAVTFNGFNGVLQVGGNIIGVADKAAVTTTANGTGTVTMVAGTQSITGNIGSSGASIGTLNIGGTGTGGTYDSNSNVSSQTTANGHIFANTVSLNNNNTGPTSSGLTMAAGRNLTGNVVTDGNGLGNLTLAGGTQTVTGTVGANGASLDTVTSGAAAATSTFTGAMYATNVNNSGTGTSVYQSTVNAATVRVDSGTSYFVGALTTSGSTRITSGTGHFSATSSGVATSAVAQTNIVFDAPTSPALPGTANLYNGLTGTIGFAGNDATVNLWDGKTISGAVTATTSNKGTVNAQGAGTLSSDVGTSSISIKELNINTLGTTSKTVNANGNVYAATVGLKNDGTLVLADTKVLQGNVTTTSTGTGSLTLTGGTTAGTNTVTGNVGSAGLALKQINAGATGATVTFGGGVAYAETLAYSGNGIVSGNGTVVFNGSSPAVVNHTGAAFSAGATDLGFVGTVDFGTNTTNTGTFTLGNNVDLITANATGASANTQTAFRDANGATLRFAGNSVVTGNLGSSADTNNENFKDIYAGANGSVVSFRGDVHVASTTFHVSGTGTVNFLGDLNGPLVYDADGTVNVADGKRITGATTTATNGTGTLNFVGSATTQAPIGTSTNLLKAVNLHANTTDSAVLPVTAQNEIVNIGHNVYALTTTVGTTQNANANSTTLNVTGNVFLGNALTLAGSNVTVNTAGGVTSTSVSPVDFLSATTAHRTLNANGTITPTAAVTQSTTGTGAITTNGATLNFAVGTTAWADPVGSVQGAGGTVNTANSSLISGGTGSTLVMTGNEMVNLSLLGSLRDGQTYTLIDVAGNVAATTGNTALPGAANLKDNSFVINTALSRANGESGDLVVTATRANGEYITKSATTGHFSNPAALRLGTLAAAGSDYRQDMQTVLNMLDIDQWGFGNNQANLATQVKRLAPVANNSLGLSAVSLGSMSSESIGMRLHELRNVPQRGAYESTNLWIKNNVLRGTQEAIGDYDGYKSKLSSFTLGMDSRPNNRSLVGAALSHGTAEVLQQQFREGDQSNLKSWQLSIYGAYDFTPELFLGGELSYGNLNSKGNRATAVGRTALFDFDGQQSAYKFDLGYRFKLADSTMSVTPLLSLEGRNIKQDAYTETNAGDIGLNVDAQRFNSKQTGLGMRLSSTEYVGGIVVKPELTLMSVRERGDFPASVTSSFIGDNTNAASFNTVTNAYEPHSAKVSLGVGVLMSKTSSMMVRYQHVKKNTSTSKMAELTARWDF